MNILWISPFLPKSDAPHAGGRSIAQWIQWTTEPHRVTLLSRVELTERVEAEAWRLGLGGLHLQEFARPTVCSLPVPKLAIAHDELARPPQRRLRLVRGPRTRTARRGIAAHRDRAADQAFGGDWCRVRDPSQRTGEAGPGQPRRRDTSGYEMSSLAVLEVDGVKGRPIRA